MGPERPIESDDVWRRVGLSDLRESLKRIQRLMKQFQGVLRALPPCNRCAQATLLEQIHTAGGRLSGEIASLSVLAQALQQAVAAAEQTQAELLANAPTPCRCSSAQCTCHD